MRCLNCKADNIADNQEYCTSCGTHLPSLLRDILPGGTILQGGKYQINYPLGQGGFGITYHGRHTLLDELVAIKEFYPCDFVFRQSSSSKVTVPHNHKDIFDKWLKRFMREGQILAKLRHNHIIQVRDLFTENDTAYLVMELVSGQTLEDKLVAQKGKPLAPPQITLIMEQLVDALAVVHQAGVYHLDLKPDNILFKTENQVVLIDFGAAKQEVMRTKTLTSKKSTRAFTEAYAAPEIMTGKEIGPYSDIFELGMMLHEMLTGELPEPALSRYMGSEWKSTGIEQPWLGLVESALRLKPSERPQSVLISK